MSRRLRPPQQLKSTRFPGSSPDEMQGAKRTEFRLWNLPWIFRNVSNFFRRLAPTQTSNVWKVERVIQSPRGKAWLLERTQ
mmetsp:Transcript_65679/g.182785  ORF Transcript_65679/g.182785 Transcript_65679/m.182785 type:complete len:81 (-) Transcript_65679:629-871(-)